MKERSNYLTRIRVLWKCPFKNIVMSGRPEKDKPPKHQGHHSDRQIYDGEVGKMDYSVEGRETKCVHCEGRWN